MDDCLAGPVCHIFNTNIGNSVLPLAWKDATVIPLRKNAAEGFSGINSLPMSLLPILSKLLEKIVCEQLSVFIKENNLTTDFQHASRKQHSTGTALAQITDDFLKYIDNKNLVGTLLLDFSSAFDVSDHKLLSDKLQCYKLAPNTICWVNSYLSNRKKYVFYNGSVSNVRELQCGVPQGSCSGPLLFSIFSDLPFVLNQTKQLCMQMTLYLPAASIRELSGSLDRELQSVGT